MEKNLSTKIRACATISSLSIIFIHNCFINQVVTSSGELPFNYIFQNFLAQGVARWGLPFFWIMSGFLFFRMFELTRATYLRKIRNRFYSLFIPYLLWSGLGILYYFFVQTFIFPSHNFSREQISSLTFSELIYVWLLNPTSYQLWFLRDLFLLVFLSPLLFILIKYFKEVFIIILFLLFISSTELFWPVQKMLSIFGFCLGGLLSMKNYAIHLSGIWFRVLVSVWLILLLINTWVLYTEQPNFIYIVFFKISRIMGVCVLWIGYDKLRIHDFLMKKEWAMKLIYFSFFLYLFHEPFLTSLRHISLIIVPLNEATGVMLFISLPMIVFFTAYYVRLGLRKYIPTAYGLLTGNR